MWMIDHILVDLDFLFSERNWRRNQSDGELLAGLFREKKYMTYSTDMPGGMA